MELRCPDCVSPEVEAMRHKHRCQNCGAHFSRGQALVTVLDAEMPEVGAVALDVFTIDADEAEAKLRDGAGSMSVINPYSDADELHALLGAAEAEGVIVVNRHGAQMLIYPLSVSEPDPIVAVDLGVGPTLLGHTQKLRQDEEEDSISFTVRFLSDVVDEANALAAGRAADSERLDRLAGYINVPGEVQGADFLEFVENELRASGRTVDVDE